MFNVTPYMVIHAGPYVYVQRIFQHFLTIYECLKKVFKVISVDGTSILHSPLDILEHWIIFPRQIGATLRRLLLRSSLYR